MGSEVILDEVVMGTQKKKFDKTKIIAIVLIAILVIGIFGTIECIVGFGEDTYVIVDMSYNDGQGVVLWGPGSESPHGLVALACVDGVKFLGERVKIEDELEYGCYIAELQTSELKFRGISTPISLLAGKYIWYRFTNNEFDII